MSTDINFWNIQNPATRLSAGLQNSTKIPVGSPNTKANYIIWRAIMNIKGYGSYETINRLVTQGALIAGQHYPDRLKKKKVQVKDDAKKI